MVWVHSLMKTIVIFIFFRNSVQWFAWIRKVSYYSTKVQSNDPFDYKAGICTLLKIDFPLCNIHLHCYNVESSRCPTSCWTNIEFVTGNFEYFRKCFLHEQFKRAMLKVLFFRFDTTYLGTYMPITRNSTRWSNKTCLQIIICPLMVNKSEE